MGVPLFEYCFSSRYECRILDGKTRQYSLIYKSEHINDKYYYTLINGYTTP